MMVSVPRSAPTAPPVTGRIHGAASDEDGTRRELPDQSAVAKQHGLGLLRIDDEAHDDLNLGRHLCK